MPMITGKLRVGQVFVKSSCGWAVGIVRTSLATRKEKIVSTVEQLSY